MNSNNELINNLLTNPVALWGHIGKLTISYRDLSLDAMETLCRYFGLVEPKLDGNYTFSARFDKSGRLKIKIGHKGESAYTLITILNSTQPWLFKDIIFHPWNLLHELEGVRGNMTVFQAWEASAISRKRKQLFDKDGICRVPSGPYYVV